MAAQFTDADDLYPMLKQDQENGFMNRKGRAHVFEPPTSRQILDQCGTITALLEQNPLDDICQWERLLQAILQYIDIPQNPPYQPVQETIVR